MRRAAIVSPSAPTPGRSALPGSAGWTRLARAVVLAVAGVGAALLAVALFDTPARAETRAGGGDTGRTADLIAHLGHPGRLTTSAPLREPAAAPAHVPLPAARSAVTGRSRLPVAPDRPGPQAPSTGETPSLRPLDREGATRPRTEPLVPRVVERVLPSRPAPPVPDSPVVPADGPLRPPVAAPPGTPGGVVPAPPGTPGGVAPAPVTTLPRPSVPVVPPRPDAGPDGPVEIPAVRPAPDPASPPGRIPLPPRLVGVVDGALRPILDLLTDLVGGVLPPILDLPGGVIGPLLPPDSATPAVPVPTPVPVDRAEQPPVTDPQVDPPWVHNGVPLPPGLAGGGGAGGPVAPPVVPVCRSAAPAASTVHSGPAPGEAPEAPVAPGEDRATGDTGPRSGAALSPETSGLDRSDRHARAEVPPAPARGRSPAVAARPG
ncbi:hypothetical protein GCM10017556_56000 [Micromonospora sagamiensis]|uniref:Uncharacterized protein n=1 Tax=Micromonospora sagamiensis TaxID=47875 RepID=A0A562WHU2_9ACTN|nr:hypothetical protein JD81_02620 [Micromonospora sagamiensis]BCL17861.1 hypothetical protein GCM10017556_56000 [Micromonospora sagamiensis]